MEIQPITSREFEELRRLQVRYRWDWPATFSANCRGEMWPFVTRGLTAVSQRTEVRGLSAILDAVVAAYLRIRPEGGRFFVDESGAFFKDEDGKVRQFILFRPIDCPVGGRLCTEV